MSYGQYLKDLLEPLGVYRLQNSLNGAELESVGAALDGVDSALGHIEREMMLLTAEEEGLEKIESLLTRRPVTTTLTARRAALAALLRIGGDSFTLTAINDNLRGCGIHAVANETGRPNYVQVSFPNVPGIPKGFEEMRKIIEDILPAHIGIEYVYWFITWAELERRFDTWGEIEAMNLSWEELETLVREEEDL